MCLMISLENFNGSFQVLLQNKGNIKKKVLAVIIILNSLTSYSASAFSCQAYVVFCSLIIIFRKFTPLFACVRTFPLVRHTP